MFKTRLIGIVFAGLLTAGAFAQEVVVRVAPPRPIVETRVVAPSHDHVWIAGYHRWDGNAYVWVPGRWELPPRPHAHWVAHKWVHRHGGYVLVEGHWKA
jgi:WXXGXW repeat (2 copies)